IKIMGFAQQAGDDASKIKKHGIVFTLGLLISLWILAAVLISLIVIGEQFLGWGFQLNNPYFLGAMIVILFVLGLNLSSVFEIGTSLTTVGGELQTKKGYSGSFFSGVLTTLVATPCTGPFMGTAMAFAFSQPIPIFFLIFTALGLGIASPYLLLSFNPKLIQKLPRPGAWMETFKKILAFPLYLTVVYFLYGFAGQTGRSGMAWLLVGLVTLALALWIYGTWGQSLGKSRSKTVGILLAAVFAIAGLYFSVSAMQKREIVESGRSVKLGNFVAHKWEPGIVEKLRSEGFQVFIDYTADT
ncbi:MAG: hypothetical protein AAF226_02160, partial [Verrucomicrobiota bacterium]